MVKVVTRADEDQNSNLQTNLKRRTSPKKLGVSILTLTPTQRPAGAANDSLKGVRSLFYFQGNLYM